MHMLHGFCSIPKVYFVFEICVLELLDWIVMVLAKLERFKIANVKITRKYPELRPQILLMCPPQNPPSRITVPQVSTLPLLSVWTLSINF